VVIAGKQVGRGITTPRGGAAQLARGPAPVASPIAAAAARQGFRAPTPTGRGRAPSTRVTTGITMRMTDTPERIPESRAASQAPPVIHLPYLPPPAPPAKKQPKRQRPHVKHTRYSDEELTEFVKRARAAGLSDGAYTRVATIGEAGPRARRRAPVDAAALMHAVAAFNRAHNNLNQIARTLNTLTLFAEEHGAGRLHDLVDELRQPIELLQDQFAAPVAAIMGALQRDREG
jgi:hypothetical protein